MPAKKPPTDRPLNVAVIGGGGREHALAWRISQSPRCGQLYAIPGNPGIAKVAGCHAEPAGSIAAVVKFCEKHDVDFVVVGPEDPLAAGMVDKLADAGIAAFGPTGPAAQLEADKAFAKQVMQQGAVPTAEAMTFHDPVRAEVHVKNREYPLVVKAAGLAKGKGVTICKDVDEALAAIDACLNEDAFGEAGHSVVIEEFLPGVECSVLALVDKRDILLLEPCQDHKPVGEGQTGPMTGGMGAFCPTSTIDDKTLRQIEAEVFVPTLDTLLRDNIKFRGCLYAGLMLTKAGPRVLEFNVRFGDPETQPLMMRWKGDVLEALVACGTGGLAKLVEAGGLAWDERAAVSVVLCSEGYPGKYAMQLPITGVDEAAAMADVEVFHSGTAMVDGQLVTNGGRVLAVTALGDDLADARAKAYEAAGKIHFDGMHYRNDIGA